MSQDLGECVNPKPEIVNVVQIPLPEVFHVNDFNDLDIMILYFL